MKVGREPFDPQVMRALEIQYPDVKFDWDQLRNTPIPSAEPEDWRERRRAERVVRRLQEEEDAQTAAADLPVPEPAIDIAPAELVAPANLDLGPDTETALPAIVDASDAGAPRIASETSGLRRRRRRRRGQRPPGAPGAPVSGDPIQTESAADASTDANEGSDDGPEEGADN